MIKLGILTSYNTKCGIAEYSRYLVEAFQKRDDIDVTVFGSKNYDGYKVAEDESYVLPVFGVLPWNSYGDHSFEVEEILRQRCDVLQVQYECVLYNQEPFYRLLSEFQGLKAITYHDNCIPPGFPFHEFNLQYTHREDVGIGSGYVLPMGIENRRPMVKTFGLGRSRKDIIEDVCLRNNWDFQYSFGEDRWRDQAELYRWLRDSDVIVLYYDEAPAAGTSLAARVALSTRRPVLVNNTTWFKDLDIDIPNLITVRKDTLEEALSEELANFYIEENSWDKIADIHVKDYTEALKGRTNNEY